MIKLEPLRTTFSNQHDRFCMDIWEVMGISHLHLDRQRYSSIISYTLLMGIQDHLYEMEVGLQVMLIGFIANTRRSFDRG